MGHPSGTTRPRDSAGVDSPAITQPSSVRPPELLHDGEWDAIVKAFRLSPRQASVLRCLFYDERSRTIAETLSLSIATVHTYRERLFHKLRVASSTQAVSVAFAAYLATRRR
jgi:DNA-binding NarL/FixJ family response regulator